MNVNLFYFFFLIVKKKNIFQRQWIQNFINSPKNKIAKTITLLKKIKIKNS